MPWWLLLLPSRPPALPCNSPKGSSAPPLSPLLSPPLASFLVFIHPGLLVEIKVFFSHAWDYFSFLVHSLPSMRCSPCWWIIPSCTNISLRLLAVSVCLSHYFWKAAKIAHDEVIFVFPGPNKTPDPTSIWVLTSAPAARSCHGVLPLSSSALPRSPAIPIQQPPSQPSGRVCPLAPSSCFPACCWVTVPAHLSGDSLLGREARSSWMPPAPHLTTLPRACFPLPRRALLQCDLATWQLALTPHLSLRHWAFTSRLVLREQLGPTLHPMYHGCSAAPAPGARHGQGISMGPPPALALVLD